MVGTSLKMHAKTVTPGVMQVTAWLSNGCKLGADATCDPVHHSLVLSKHRGSGPLDITKPHPFLNRLGLTCGRPLHSIKLLYII